MSDRLLLESEEIFKTDKNLGSVEWLIKGLASTIKGPVSPLSLLSIPSLCHISSVENAEAATPIPFPHPLLHRHDASHILSIQWHSPIGLDITNLCDSPWGQSQPAGRRRSPSGLLLCHTSGDSSSVAPIGRHLQQPLLPCQSTTCGFKSVRWGQEYFSSPIFVSFFLSHLTRNWCHKSFCRPLIWVTSAKGPTLCIGCLPALGWNGKKQGSAQNVWYTNRVKKKLSCFCIGHHKNESGDQTQRGAESRRQRSCNDTSQPRKGAAKGGVGEREAAHCQCLITHFGWLSDPE